MSQLVVTIRQTQLYLCLFVYVTVYASTRLQYICLCIPVCWYVCVFVYLSIIMYMCRCGSASFCLCISVHVLAIINITKTTKTT